MSFCWKSLPTISYHNWLNFIRLRCRLTSHSNLPSCSHMVDVRLSTMPNKQQPQLIWASDNNGTTRDRHHRHSHEYQPTREPPARIRGYYGGQGPTGSHHQRQGANQRATGSTNEVVEPPARQGATADNGGLLARTRSIDRESLASTGNDGGPLARMEPLTRSGSCQ